MTQRIVSGLDRAPRRPEWEMRASFYEDGYELIAPDGTRCGHFPTLREAVAEQTRLLKASLEHTKESA